MNLADGSIHLDDCNREEQFKQKMFYLLLDCVIQISQRGILLFEI